MLGSIINFFVFLGKQKKNESRTQLEKIAASVARLVVRFIFQVSGPLTAYRQLIALINIVQNLTR